MNFHFWFLFLLLLFLPFLGLLSGLYTFINAGIISFTHQLTQNLMVAVQKKEEAQGFLLHAAPVRPVHMRQIARKQQH